MFPAWEADAVAEILDVCGNDVEMACEMIMRWTVDDSNPIEGEKTDFMIMKHDHSV